MRNIPMFTTEYGVASLILREIPYRQEADIRIQDTADPEAFLEECVSFCRMAGAEKIFATGHAILSNYPMYTAVWRMQRPLEGLPDTDAMTMPVTEQTIDHWCEIYNKAMAPVPNASYMDSADGKRLLEQGNGYFVHRDGTLLGIGIASGDVIQAIASVVLGAGSDVLLALTHALSGEQVFLEVASENRKAIKLYERFGFLKTAELSCWYHVNK